MRHSGIISMLAILLSTLCIRTVSAQTFEFPALKDFLDHARQASIPAVPSGRALILSMAIDESEDIAAARAAMQRKDYSSAISLLSRAIESGRLEEKEEAAAYLCRGQSLAALKRLDEALSDFNEAVRLAPGDGEAYFERAVIYYLAGRYEDEFSNIDEALRITPDSDAVLFLRAKTEFLLGRFREAAEDISLAFAGHPEMVSPGVLWRHLARARAGEDDSLEFVSNARGLKVNDWHRTVVRLFLGELSEAAFLEAAAKDDERIDSMTRACHAQYFLGEYHLLRGSPAKSKGKFLIAASLCHDNFHERSAMAEYKRLSP